MEHLHKYTPTEIWRAPYGFTYKEMTEVIGESEAKRLLQCPKPRELCAFCKRAALLFGIHEGDEPIVFLSRFFEHCENVFRSREAHDHSACLHRYLIYAAGELARDVQERHHNTDAQIVTRPVFNFQMTITFKH